MLKTKLILSLCYMVTVLNSAVAQERARVREFGIEPGILDPGNWNAITDI